MLTISNSAAIMYKVGDILNYTALDVIYYSLILPPTPGFFDS